MGVLFMRQSGNSYMPIVMMTSFLLTDYDKFLDLGLQDYVPSDALIEISHTAC